MERVRLFIALVAAGLLAACATAQPQVKRETAGVMGVYGNWCGPDHPKDVAANPSPIDALDAACMRHDLCYTERGFLSCECDAAFTQELYSEMAKKTYTGFELATARATHAHFAASPCAGDMKSKARPVRLLKGVYDGTKRRVVDAFDRVTGAPAAAAPAAEPALPATAQ